MHASDIRREHIAVELEIKNHPFQNRTQQFDRWNSFDHFVLGNKCDSTIAPNPPRRVEYAMCTRCRLDVISSHGYEGMRGVFFVIIYLQRFKRSPRIYRRYPSGQHK